MVKPVLLVVDDEADSLWAPTQELESRYGSHYQILASASAGDALARLAELRADGAAVPLILADQWMPETTGIEFLTRMRTLHPTARDGHRPALALGPDAVPAGDEPAGGVRHW
jgi:CheY-like chemotaxis protein